MIRGLDTGVLIWMVIAELIPEAIEECSGPTIGTAVTLAFTALFLVQTFLLQH